ncbi:MAG TPA: cytochrome P450 [Solirubrobacteraceae bacterium]|nr:cytochrome P450 [Solirubrobacteraceae bacterium]
MTLVSELDLPSFDYTDPTLRGDAFHAAMAEVREASWLAQAPFGYMVLDREAGEHFLRTRSAIFPGMKIAEIFGVTEGPLHEQMVRNILHVNGPDHSRLRSLVNPALSPRAVERYRPRMRGFLEGLFAAAVEGAGEGDEVRCDFVEAFAKPYPSQVIASVMGAPLEDAPRLHHWSNWIQKQFDAGSMASEKDKIEEAVEEFYEYAEGLLRARRADPGDDLMSRFIEAEEEGDRLSDVECINLVFNILAGGVDTTQSQMAHAIRLLAERPEQWRLLGERPELAEAAVEEALRYEPITPFTARIMTEEVTYRDVVFPEDTVVMVCAFTANRDLEEGGGGAGGDPDLFDITVDRGRARPLTFGAGVHYCLGANLARLEMQEGLTFLSERLGGLALDGEPVFGTVSGIYGLDELPIRFTV